MSPTAFAALLAVIVRLFRRRMRDVLSGMDTSRSPAEMAKYLYGPMVEARHLAHSAAVVFLSEQAKRQGDFVPWVPDEPAYTERALASAIREAGDLSTDNARRRLEATLERHVRASARQTIIDAVEDAPAGVDLADGLEDLEEDLGGFPEEDREEIRKDAERARKKAERSSSNLAEALEEATRRVQSALDDLEESDLKVPSNGGQPGSKLVHPFAWARVVNVSDKGPCGFCAILASRGPVYSSAERAGQRVDKFHDNCRCDVVPVYTSKDWPGKDDHIYYANIYKEVAGLGQEKTRTAMDNIVRGTRSAEKSAARKRRKKETDG